jgi:hypothetical protein
MKNPETMKHFVRGFYYAVLGNSICHIHFAKAISAASQESSEFIDYLYAEEDKWYDPFARVDGFERISQSDAEYLRGQPMPFFLQLGHERGANTSYDERD